MKSRKKRIYQKIYPRFSLFRNVKPIFLASLVVIGLFFLIVPLIRFNTPWSTIIIDDKGELLAGSVAEDGQWRFPPSDSVPYKFMRSLLLFEDEYFYMHPGFNPVSLLKAAMNNIRKKKIVSGGSTITMQLVRLNRPAKRTYQNKIKELIMAVRLELALSKDSILLLYSTHAPFGGNIEGLEAASWRYFNRDAHELTWAESALLAVLPNAPGLMHPGRNRDELTVKRDKLLDKLFYKGEIDSLTWLLSLAEHLPEKPLPMPQITPHLLEEAIINYKGRKNIVSLDANLQRRASEVVIRHNRSLQQNEIYNIAALIACVKTGKVLAHIGNAPETSAKHVNIINAPRSAGSILKPFLYAAAVEDAIILPKSLLPDIPTWYKDFSPRNFQRSYNGAVHADNALSRSLNVPFVRLLDNYGGERFLKKLHQCGFKNMNETYSHYGLSLILGGSEVTLWELAGAYATMARILNYYNENNGLYCINNIHGLYAFSQNTPPVKEIKQQFHPSLFRASAIYSTFTAMKGLERPEEETGWEYFASGNREIAWKTGTSYGYRDAWSVGLSSEYVVAVWVGNASGEGRPGILGASAAGPVMFELFSLLPSLSGFEIPWDDMRQEAVCRQSGYRAGRHCEPVDTIWIPHTIRNTESCPYHFLVHLSLDGKYRTSIECEKNAAVISQNFFSLPPLMEWYYKIRHPEYKSLPPFKPGCGESDYHQAMEFIYPPSNTSLLIPVGIDGNLSKMVISAVHRNINTKIYWHINGKYEGKTEYKHEKEYSPVPGENIITLVDENGNKISRRFICVDPE